MPDLVGGWGADSGAGGIASMYRLPIAISLGAAIAVGGCGGHDVYREEAFQVESPFRVHLNVSAREACEAAQLALLSQGYRIESAQPLANKARKDFQPEKERSAAIEFNVVCKDYQSGSILFANAVQTSYELKKSRQATSISVPTAGSLSLPFGSTTESLIKVAEETISDETFYARFFALVRTYLGQEGKSAK